MRFLRNLADAILSATAASMEDTFGYPVHDAMIAAGALTKTRRFSLDDMKSLLNCTHRTEAIDQFENAIPKIISKALEKRSTDSGRILEYGNDTFLVGRNYALNLQAVTVSCVVTDPFNTGIKGAAYASQILASDKPYNLLPENTDPRAYNLSMLLEADVMEPPLSSLLFMPKKYCLDLRDKDDKGITAWGPNSFALAATSQSQRVVSLGTRASTFKPTRNRVTWKIREDWTWDSFYGVIRRAYQQPKPELLALTHVYEDRVCSSITGTLLTYYCVVNETFSWLSKRGLEPSFDGFSTAVSQVDNMRSALLDWIQEKLDFVGFPHDHDGSNEELEALRNKIKEDYPAAPLLFDRSIAENSKNAPLYGSLQVNPFFTREELEARIVVQQKEGNETLHCALEQSQSSVTASSALQSASYEFPGVMKRRLFERAGTPQNNIATWSHLNDNFWKDVSVLRGVPVVDINEQYYDQNVSWKINDFEDGYDLQPGNLTNRTMGRTAQWLMTSSWGAGPELQELFEAQQSSLVYSEASTKAVVLDNPCGDTATNADIFLFVLAMVVAAFGAVD